MTRKKWPFSRKSLRPDGSLHGESWLFHMDAAFEDTQRQGGELMWKGGKDVINSTRSGEVFVDMGGMFDLYSIS